MSGERQAPRQLPNPRRVVRHLEKIGGLLGLTRTESEVLAAFALGALADWIGQWAENDGLTMTDVTSWLDQVANAAVTPEHHQSHP